jgi:hypothetical protein
MKDEKPVNVCNQIAVESLKKGGTVRCGKRITAQSNGKKITVSGDSIYYGGNDYVREVANRVKKIMESFGCKCGNVKHSIYGIYVFELNAKKEEPETESDDILEEEEVFA